MTDLRIRRLENRYRLPAWPADVDATARRLDTVAATRLPRAIEALLPGLAARAGLAPDSEIVVRDLGVRVTVADPSVGPAQLAAGWARAFATALERALGESRGYGVGPDVAIFRDRISAEARFLVMRALGARPQWWWQALIAEAGRLPAPERIVARWIDEAPERAPAEIARAARAAPDGFGVLFADADADALVERLIGRRARRRRELTGRPAAAVPPRGDAARVARDVAPALRRPLRSTPARGARRLLALAFVLERSPSAGIESPAELDALVRTVLDAAPDATALDTKVSPPFPDTARDKPATPASRHLPVPVPSSYASHEPSPDEPPHTDSTEPRPVPASVQFETGLPPHVDSGAKEDRPGTALPRIGEDGRRDAAEALPEAPDDHSGEIGCGGLLYLIRPLARHELVRAHTGDALEARLLAFARLALERVLAPLRASRRRAALARERPLLEVFAGTEVPEEDLDDAPGAGPAYVDAVQALAEIAATISPDIDPCADGLRFTFGEALPPPAEDGPTQALASLVLRHGRLDVTATHADLHLPLASVDVALRRGGWDIDPGWVPYLGRVIRFHYLKP